MTQIDTTFFRGKGNSLWPLAGTNTLVEIEEVSFNTFRAGDLIAYCANKEIICHRILKIREVDALFWYFCKGDTHLEPDGWIPQYRMLGKVTHLDSHSLELLPYSLYSSLMYWLSLSGWQVYRLLLRPLIARYFKIYPYHFLSVQKL